MVSAIGFLSLNAMRDIKIIRYWKQRLWRVSCMRGKYCKIVVNIFLCFLALLVTILA